MNGRKLCIVNTNKIIYYIKLNDKNLEIYNRFFHKTIQKNIELFDLQYNNDFIFILFISADSNSKLGLIKINISNTDEIHIDWLESDNASYTKIDCISIEIADNHIHFFYRKYDLQNTISYIYHGIVSNSCQLYELCKINYTQYVCSLYTITLNNKIFLLLCENYERGIYSLRCLSENETIPIRSFDLPNAFSLNLIAAKDTLILFYNKIIDKDICFMQKNIPIIGQNFILSDEIIIDVDKSIIKPIVSFYNNKFYIFWNTKNYFYMLATKDLINWDKIRKFNKNHNIQGTIITVDSSVKIFNGFINEKITSTKIEQEFELTMDKKAPTVINNNVLINNYLLYSLNSLSLKYIKLLSEKDREVDNLKRQLLATTTQYERRLSKLAIASNSLRNYYEDLVSNLLTIIEDKGKLIEQLFKFNNKNNT